MGVKESKKSSSKYNHKQYDCYECSTKFIKKKDLTRHILTCNRKGIEAKAKLECSRKQNQLIIKNTQGYMIKNDSNLTNETKSSLSDLPTSLNFLSFNSKVKEFHSALNKIKIDWREGCDTIEVDRQAIVCDSIKEFQTINPLKELKIKFKGEVSQDAGGLIREWLCVLFKHFLDENTDLFIRTDTDDISYLIKRKKVITSTLIDSYYFIGKLIGKALLENLTINCCFNKLIYKLILDESIQLEELIFIDTPLYHSLKEMMNMKNNIDDLYLFFSLEYEDDNGVIQSENLIPNGNSIKVTKDNIDLYIQKRIDHLVNSQKVLANEIRKGIISIIPMRFLKQFTSDEFGLILNGTPFIDLEDWKNHTMYKDYKSTDSIIIDYWAVMSTLSQENLSRFLQFCTGSSRVPIGGFSSLESNRGNKAMFCITKANYYPSQVNYIKAHTCFNRLDLPDFPSKSQLESSISFILRNETIGFGID